MYKKIYVNDNHQVWWKDSLFKISLLCAVLLHVGLLQLRFGEITAPDAASKEIAIALRPTKDHIEKADFLAQADQQGTGKFRELHKTSTDIAEAGLQQNRDIAPSIDLFDQLQQQRSLSFEEKILMTTLSWQKQVQQHSRQKAMQKMNRQFQAKAAMVASIEAQYSQHKHDLSRLHKIKTLDSIQAKQDIAAHYLEKFREKVEFYGNRDYPHQAKQQPLAGEVRLMVILNPQGGIRAIRLIESSGSKILDAAAKSSVKRAAPFGIFDAKMKEISELRVIRTWRFDPAEAEFNVY